MRRDHVAWAAWHSDPTAGAIEAKINLGLRIIRIGQDQISTIFIRCAEPGEPLEVRRLRRPDPAPVEASEVDVGGVLRRLVAAERAARPADIAIALLV